MTVSDVEKFSFIGVTAVSSGIMKQKLLCLFQRLPCNFRPGPRNLQNQLRLPTSSSGSVAAISSMTSVGSNISSAVAYEYVEDVENLKNYRPGGYHPIAIGEELENRYRVVHKLGFGTYSTTWLMRDEQSGKLVAVKVGTAESRPHEVDVLLALNSPRPSSFDDPGTCLIPPILNTFKICGPNGIHPCYVTTPARMSLAEAKDGSYVELFQLDVARALAAQLTQAVAYTHSRGYIHGGESYHKIPVLGWITNPSLRSSPGKCSPTDAA